MWWQQSIWTGKPHPKFSINFDSTSFKDRKTLLTQLGAMRELGEAGLVKAGKDISNPGLLGTLGMLLETSKVGAVDSIPAILAITQDQFIVYTSNVFAILGLRSLYFALAGVVHRFWLLSYGLAVVLIFVGIKMLTGRFL